MRLRKLCYLASRRIRRLIDSCLVRLEGFERQKLIVIRLLAAGLYPEPTQIWIE